LKQAFCVPFWYKTGANARPVRKVTGFVDGHYLYKNTPMYGFANGIKSMQFDPRIIRRCETGYIQISAVYFYHALP
jgi:hypothetical protein